MSPMYNPVNEDIMFQQMHDRAESMRRLGAGRGSERAARRWWRR
jgi:hypothetical protein